MYQLVFYVPETHKEEVKDALFNAGAGRYEDYDCCSFESAGTGQFRPLDKANPFIGESGKLEKVKEYKVEMVVPDDQIKKVTEELIRSHPYEEPAYSIWKILTVNDL